MNVRAAAVAFCVSSLVANGPSDAASTMLTGKMSLFWTVSADSNGATESQMSPDGVTYSGKLDDGKTTSNATNVFTMISSKRWTVRARGTAGGQPYDLIVTCDRT